MQSLRRSQVIMDMDFKWGGDASVVLAINPVVGPKLPVQLKNFSLFATIRVMFQLSEEVPCISALVVALLAKPKFQIKYNLKVIGGSTGVIPGLGDMIEASVLSFHPLFMFSSNLQNIATILLDICNFVNQEIISYKRSMYIGKHKSIGTFLVSNIRSHGS
jgi:hypothetical protein